MYQDHGIGLIQGLHIPRAGFCSQISEEAFNKGVVIELSGADDDVVKFLPSLLIEEDILREGLQVIDQAIGDLLARKDELRGGAVL